MSLNPLRDTLARAGLDASRQDTPFKAEADAALAGFQAVRDNLERQVRRGVLTPRVARQLAGESATRLRDQLAARVENYSPVPRAFLDRLVEASEARKASRDRGSLESLQRETNRLLRLSLIEQQVESRAAEFEGQAFARGMVGGVPAPTLDGLLKFHETASQAGDDPAMEWARRQLEGLRSRTPDAEEHWRIDQACDRPDRLNPRIVARYVEALRPEPAENKESFVGEAAASRDANACVASFLLARESTEGTSARWVRTVLDSIRDFPDAAVNSLRAWEAESRREDAQAAKARADFVCAIAEADSRFPGLEAPSPAELERIERLEKLPVAQPDEPIGLALERRGFLPEELAEI